MPFQMATAEAAEFFVMDVSLSFGSGFMALAFQVTEHSRLNSAPCYT